MKDYLVAEGYEVKSPRESIKQAFQYGLIEDGALCGLMPLKNAISVPIRMMTPS